MTRNRSLAIVLTRDRLGPAARVPADRAFVTSRFEGLTGAYVKLDVPSVLGEKVGQHPRKHYFQPVK